MRVRSPPATPHTWASSCRRDKARPAWRMKAASSARSVGESATGRAMLPAEGLTPAQTELVRTIILELQSPHPGAARTLTPRQMDILNGLLFEFTRRG